MGGGFIIKPERGGYYGKWGLDYLRCKLEKELPTDTYQPGMKRLHKKAILPSMNYSGDYGLKDFLDQGGGDSDMAVADLVVAFAITNPAAVLSFLMAFAAFEQPVRLPDGRVCRCGFGKRIVSSIDREETSKRNSSRFSP